VADLIRQGKELGEADDIVFGRNNSKQENGAVGLLTGDVINRAQLYEMAVILAFIPFKNLDLYPSVYVLQKGVDKNSLIIYPPQRGDSLI
jgi:non-canonical (house-cleaning) NTP pyrophosphatase